MKKNQKKHQLSKAALPFVALFGGNACASTRNPLSLQSSLKKSGKSVVYLQDSHKPELPALISSQKNRDHLSPFSAFTKKQVASHAPIDRSSRNAMSFLKEQGLLDSQNVTQSSVSGNTISRKNFSDDWIASLRLSTPSANVNSACVAGATYAGQSLDSFFATRRGPFTIGCSLYGNGSSTITSASVSMSMSNQGGRCRDFHMACDQQPLPVELMKFEVE